MVGKCLLENCLICYTLLSPSGKSASLCYFGKFSEMIRKKKKVQQNIFRPNNFSRLSQGRKRGVKRKSVRKQAAAVPLRRGRGNSVSKQRSQSREAFGPGKDTVSITRKASLNYLCLISVQTSSLELSWLGGVDQPSFLEGQMQ